MNSETTGKKIGCVGHDCDVCQSRLTKEDYLDLIKLLSALESWSFSSTTLFPDYLHDQLQSAVEKLSKEVLK